MESSSFHPEPPSCTLFFFKIFILLLFIWLHRILVAARRIFSLHWQHVGSLVAACRIQFLDQGLKPVPLHWELRVLATAPHQGRPPYPFITSHQSITMCYANSTSLMFSSPPCIFVSTPLGYVMEKAMALHSSTLAWKIPWMEEPGGPQSVGSLGVRYDSATSLSLFTFMHWRRKWQPTPVFLPGESQGRGSLVGCRLWGHTESDTTEATQQDMSCQSRISAMALCLVSLLPSLLSFSLFSTDLPRLMLLMQI